VARDTRDKVIDYVRHWSGRTELPAKQLVKWMGMGMSKYHDWKKRYGQVNEQNGRPRRRCHFITPSHRGRNQINHHHPQPANRPNSKFHFTLNQGSW
jgi:hypothetical protein